MSVSAAIEPVEADSAREAHALAFRIAFATAIGFTLGHVLGWDFPFLPAMLAVQLRGPLSVKQGLAFVAVMVAACVFAVLISQIFDRSPLVLLLVVSLSGVSAAGSRPGCGGGGDIPHHHGGRAAAGD